MGLYDYCVIGIRGRLVHRLLHSIYFSSSKFGFQGEEFRIRVRVRVRVPG